MPAFLQKLLSSMTLEEKLGQMTQATGRSDNGQFKTLEEVREMVRRGKVGSFLGFHGAERTERLQRLAVTESRLGIPLLFADDVIHGFRTIFPVPVAEAASFDLAAIEQSARIAAAEASASGLHWTFAPMVDIARDPRWGRVVEGAGEDRYLGARVAEARIRGFQGDNLRAGDTILATAKHFVAYGAAEGGRDYNVADLSERTLREIYLSPFEASVRAGVQTIMAAFNEVAGIPMHAHEGLIRGVLRQELGFDGVVISDYNGIAELMPHGVAADAQAAGLLALRAGVDIDMAGGIYSEKVLDGRALNESPLAQVDEAVQRVLMLKHRLGLFDDPFAYSSAELERTRLLSPGHREAARDMARRSMVLLKNDGGVLPLGGNCHSMALIGALADDPISMLGSWSAAGQPGDVITPLAGIRAAAGSAVRVAYARGDDTSESPEDSIEHAAAVARDADCAVLFLGERADQTGEARSRSSLKLPPGQIELARAVLHTGTPVATVLFTGRPLSLGWLDANLPSILLAWYPGVEAGHALADIILGHDSPAGRLPMTFPRTVGQVPIYYNHKSTGRPPSADITNTAKYIDVPWTPLYTFGHGLTYTRFEYQDARVDRQRIAVGDSVRLTVELGNEGDRAADEVAQVYLRDEVASVTRPILQLCAFQRVHLGPGERKVLTFDIGPEDMALYNADMRLQVEPGRFTLLVGGNPDQLLETPFEVTSRDE